MPKLDVDEALIRKLADLLKETGLNEIEYESGPQRIRVNRGQAHGAVLAPALAAPAVLAPPAAPPAAVVEGPPAGAVTSPMVGTAYLAAEPGASPFVKVGQTLLIIEAMKVMNPILASQGGTVSDIMISDGRPVEFGEVLMVVR